MANKTQNLASALCRGLSGHGWAPKPTAVAIVIKDGLAYVTEDCARCKSTRFMRVDMTKGKIVYRRYINPESFRLLLAEDEPRPTKSELRLEAITLLAASRKVRTETGSKQRRAAS